MTTTDQDIEAAMAELRTTAPASLRPAVLAEIGLADLYARFDSPIGPLVVAWNGRGVSAVEAAEDDSTFEAHHRARTGRAAYDAGTLPPRLATAIARRLDGDRRAHIDLDLRGHTEFERDVWLKALEIPRGEVRPYGWVAAEIGRPKASVRWVRRSGTTRSRSSCRVTGSSGVTGPSGSTRLAGRATSGRSSRQRASTFRGSRRWLSSGSGSSAP